MIIAHISDLHIHADRGLLNGKYDSSGNLEAIVAALNGMQHQPDLILATGDLVHYGSRAEYACLRELLTPLRAPCYLMPGNHDDRNKLCAAFPEHHYLQDESERLNYIIDDFPVRLIVLDSVIPDEIEGALGEAQLGWLDTMLSKQPVRPTIVALHHPPFGTGIAFRDNFTCADGPELEQIVGRHPHVQRVLCGHLHRSIQVPFGGTIATVAPSTAVSFGLAIAPGVEFHRTDEPVGFQLHAWSPPRGVITHTVLLPLAPPDPPER